MSVYDDHIRLWNEGILPEGYTVETLMSKHTSRPRNPKIAQVFYRAGFIEAWGRGYEKINKAFDTENLKRPIFLSEQGGISAIIPREIFMAIRQGFIKNGDSSKNNKASIIGESSVNRTKTEPKPNQNRTKTEQMEKILELIKDDPLITKIEIADKLELHKSSVQRRIDALVKEGRLRHSGPNNGGIWEVIEVGD